MGKGIRLNHNSAKIQTTSNTSLPSPGRRTAYFHQTKPDDLVSERCLRFVLLQLTPDLCCISLLSRAEICNRVSCFLNSLRSNHRNRMDLRFPVVAFCSTSDGDTPRNGQPPTATGLHITENTNVVRSVS